MDVPFMNTVARGLAARGIEVVRFEFPYMAQRRSGGSKKKPPDREPVLRQSWQAMVESRRDERPLFIGGKSMGGRIATLVADELEVAGLICLGYPFHPPGRLQQLRTAHLAALRTPALIVQGTRDAFGSREDVAGYELSPAIRIHWLEGGDHSFKPPAGAAYSAKELLDQAIAAVAGFIEAGSA